MMIDDGSMMGVITAIGALAAAVIRARMVSIMRSILSDSGGNSGRNTQRKIRFGRA